jgi:flagellar hook-associated protein 2
MGTITMTGYNNIDWGTVLNAVMSQEKQPLNNLQAQYTQLQLRSTNFATLATKLSALESAAADLQSSTGFSGRSAASTDATSVSISAGSSAATGTYDVVVTKLARAQVSTSATTVGSKDAVVATGGSLTFTTNGVDHVVQLTGDTTLQQLADSINGTADVGVTANIVSANGRYRLMLTADESGATSGFGVVGNALEGVVGEPGGTQFTFNDVPAVAASDADLTVNNVQVTSSSNVFEDVIPGATITALKETGGSPIVLTVSQDSSETKTKLQSFITAYNDLNSFFASQAQSAKDGAAYTLSRDSLTRTLRREINSAILGSMTSAGSLNTLADIGLEFERDGSLTLNNTMFNDAAKTKSPDLQALFAGTSTTDGVFDLVKSAISTYTIAGGLVSDARTRLTDQMAALNDRIASEQARLDMRKIMLQKEYAAADSAIATLNAQGTSLANLGK